MKLAIVKQQYVPGYTWGSHQWDDPGSVIDDFMLRSKNFALLYATQGDVWVVEDGDYVPSTLQMMREQRAEGLALLYQAHRDVTTWDAIKWNEYDVVITVDPIAPRRIIDSYPTVLWAYYAAEHSGGDWVGDFPRRGYDLFLDHTLCADETQVNTLPALAHFPAVVSRQAFGSVVRLQEQEIPSAFVDSHAIRGVEDLLAWAVEIGSFLGVRVLHAQPWDFAHSYACVAQRKMWSTRDYLQAVAECRYFLLTRDGGGYMGQAAPEAAALGCIVVAGRSLYTERMCHPACLLEKWDWERAGEIVRRLEADPYLRGEVKGYQDAVLRTTFLDWPLAMLGKWARVKKGR